MMPERTSYVDALKVRILAYSSVIQLGDSKIINGMSRAIAVQREAEIFYGDEGNFASYPIFSEPLIPPPVTESIYSSTHHLNPIIKVNCIDITGISSSSLLHVGNSQNVMMETRVKHIRQIFPHPEEEIPGGR